MGNHKKLNRLTRNALLTGAALIIFTIEASLPAPIPVPGVKLGLSNIITLYSMFALTPADTLAILCARLFLGSLFAGSLSTLMYSAAGGICCYLVMLLLRRLLSRNQIWIAGVCGAVAHNLGQILVAVAVTRTPALLAYFPVLLLSGMLAGLFTGFCSQFLIHRLILLQKDP